MKTEIDQRHPSIIVAEQMGGRTERGSYEITDEQLIALSQSQLRFLQRELEAVAAMNPQLVVTVSTDLMKRTTLIEWEPREPAALRVAEITHRAPIAGGTTPCCGATPFELGRFDRLTSDDSAVTCGQWAKL
jgi:hypothetical protein